MKRIQNRHNQSSCSNYNIESTLCQVYNRGNNYDLSLKPPGWPCLVDGGKAAECEHEWGEELREHHPGQCKQTKTGNAEAAMQGQTAKSGTFCRRCGAWRGSLGLEPTPELFVSHIVEIFREVRRVLRKDAVCFINMGDGLKDKNLIGMPWRVAFSLQADGWWLRQEIIWAKKAPMPESVTDRFTKAHEQIFLLTKSPKYYFDQEAVREAGEGFGRSERFRGDKYTNNASFDNSADLGITQGGGKALCDGSGRNMRDVWLLGPEPFPDAHFATFVSEVPRRCIKAGTSERGVCPNCGAPWKRVVEKKGLTAHDGETDCQYEKGTTANRLALLRQAARARGDEYHNEVHTLGWAASCQCGIEATQPAIILDPFGGSGTTGIVANELGRRAILIELNPAYAAMAVERLRQEVLL